MMQMKLETLDEFLEEPIIPKVYRDLVSIFTLSNANSLPIHQDKDYAIKLDVWKTFFLGLLYNFSGH